MIPLLIVPSIICLIIIYLYLPETLGKETHEIVREIRCIKRKYADSEDSGSSSSSEDNVDAEQKNAMI